jgi:type VI secretion system protein ImpK
MCAVAMRAPERLAAPPGTSALFEGAPLLEWFRRLYLEVTVLKGQLLAAPPLADPGPLARPGAMAEEPVAAAIAGVLTSGEVHGRLRSILEERPVGGSGALEEVRYALAALADEVFIHLDWSGGDAWRFNLLEASLFGTHRAGEEVFRRIDDLLEHGDRSARHMELALVYQLMLALGYEGKHRGDADGPVLLADYRRRLFQFATGRRPDPAQVLELAPGSAVSGPLPGIERRLPYLRRWVWTLATVTVLWLVVSQLLWNRLTGDLTALLNRILG